MFILYTSVH